MMFCLSFPSYILLSNSLQNAEKQSLSNILRAKKHGGQRGYPMIKKHDPETKKKKKKKKKLQSK
jgi:hypothetical protein